MGRRTMLLVAAFVVAALGTTLVFLYVSSADNRALANQKPVEVLVAKSDIPAGTTGAEAEADVLFAPTVVARSSVVDGALSSSAAIRDKFALSTIFKGQQVIARQFGESSQTSPLTVPDGSLAVSVAVDDPNRLGQFLTAGSEVAVFVTTTTSAGPKTEVLLSKVTVIANGSQTLSSPTGDSTGGTLLTLAVDQSQAQRLIASSQGGKLYFALLTPSASVDSGDQGYVFKQGG